MKRIKFFVDSGSDISPEIAKKHNIGVIPLTIAFGNKTFKDFYDLSSRKFFDLLETLPDFPKTSQPNPYEFINEFRAVENECEDIICFTMSKNGSGTYYSAINAKKELEEAGFKANIHIVDSKSASLGETLLAIKATKLLELDETANEIVSKMRDMAEFLGSYFIPTNLDALLRGGRVNTVSAIVGSALHIKPVIQIRDGWGRNVSKVIGENGINKKFIDIFLNKCQNTKEVFISHANNLQKANELADKFKEKITGIKIHLSEMGSVMGTHVGKGGLGIFFIEKDPIMQKI
jgi:DegV family protein with EDD domain